MTLLPGLGDKYNVEIEMISNTRDTYRSAEYLATGLPTAPALMLADKILVQGRPISQEDLESAIRGHLAQG